ncbi:MAG TPA: CopG family transcriptional regulator [Stellaceae bacterium]|nr:CopG family transcriptional regulator [Stellaceae bacterium]
MRTTLTIEPDIAARLARLRKSRDSSLKALVNEALREGLRQLSLPKKPHRGPFTQPVDLGQPLIGNVDCIGDLLARLEGELYR